MNRAIELFNIFPNQAILRKLREENLPELTDHQLRNFKSRFNKQRNENGTIKLKKLLRGAKTTILDDKDQSGEKRKRGRPRKPTQIKNQQDVVNNEDDYDETDLVKKEPDCLIEMVVKNEPIKTSES